MSVPNYIFLLRPSSMPSVVCQKCHGNDWLYCPLCDKKGDYPYSCQRCGHVLVSGLIGIQRTPHNAQHPGPINFPPTIPALSPTEIEAYHRRASVSRTSVNL
jgi:hypothetical protein